MSRRARECFILLCLTACQSGVKTVPATRLVVRIDADAPVLRALVSLRVRTSSEVDNAWIERNNSVFARDDLTWPVDIVLAPRTEPEGHGALELIVEALDADEQVLVQARGVSAYVPRRDRMLPLFLAACGGEPLGTLCEADAECHGLPCQTCVEDTCQDTPVTARGDLLPLEPEAVPEESEPEESEPTAVKEAGVRSSRDAAAPSRRDAGTGEPAGAAVQPPADAGAEPDLDAAAKPGRPVASPDGAPPVPDAS